MGGWVEVGCWPGQGGTCWAGPHLTRRSYLCVVTPECDTDLKAVVNQVHVTICMLH